MLKLSFIHSGLWVNPRIKRIIKPHNHIEGAIIHDLFDLIKLIVTKEYPMRLLDTS